MVFDAGAALEPSGREGVAELVARAFSEGTAAKGAYEFGVAAERLGASWRASSDWDSLRVGLEVPVSELVLRRLLPMARDGLERWGIDPHDADRLLSIIERRCVAVRNGASWQSEVFHRLYDEKGMDRREALRQMTRRYRHYMHSNEPVHTWPAD